VPIATAVPLHGVREDRDIEHVRAAVEQFVAVGAAAVRDPRPDDDHRRLLLAMPSFGTGGGGGAHERGRILRTLLEAAEAAAAVADVDVVLVLPDDRSYALAQRIRRERPERWSVLPARREEALRLADLARQGALVPFLGAGVSVSAGAPTWRGLIEHLSRGAGLTDAERTELLDGPRSALDQAAILRSRFERRPNGGRAFRTAIADAVRLERYGLAPALIASLRTEQAITLNYDSLFEQASHDAGFARRIIPSGGDEHAKAWLLKLHGSVDDPETIVLTRDDYLGFNANRASLSAIVKANLLTRHLLFVGFGLADDHFHEIVHDVQRALPERGRSRATALTLCDDPLDAELWQGSLDLVPMASRGTPVEDAARELEIFLDMLAAYADDSHEYLLDDDFATILSDDERHLKQMLEPLSAAEAGVRALPAWVRVQALLDELGA